MTKTEQERALIARGQRTRVFAIRLTTEEHKRFLAAAEDEHLTISAWLRRLAWGASKLQSEDGQATGGSGTV